MTIKSTIPNEQIINGEAYLADSKGRLQPVATIKPFSILEHEVVTKVVDYARDLSDQVARFKSHTFDDLSGLEAILEQEYGLTKGGTKGNKTFTSHDGLKQVKIAVQDHIDFGPQLQVAKALIDECLNEWATGAGPELRTIVTRAFNTDKVGQVNRAEVFMLLRLEIDDERWKRAMEAIRDAMRVVGSKTYVRCFERPDQNAAWSPITIDLAKA